MTKNKGQVASSGDSSNLPNDKERTSSNLPSNLQSQVFYGGGVLILIGFTQAPVAVKNGVALPLSNDNIFRMN